MRIEGGFLAACLLAGGPLAAAEPPGAWFLNAHGTGRDFVYFSLGGTADVPPSRLGEVVAGWSWDESGTPIERYPGAVPVRYRSTPLPGKRPQRWYADSRKIGLPPLGIGPGRELLFLGSDERSTAEAMGWAALLDAVEAAWRHSSPDLAAADRRGVLEIGRLGRCAIRSLPVEGEGAGWATLTLDGHARPSKIGGFYYVERLDVPAERRRAVAVQRFLRFAEGPGDCGGRGLELQLIPVPRQEGFDPPYFVIWGGIEPRNLGPFDLAPEPRTAAVRRLSPGPSSGGEQQVNVAAWPEAEAEGIDLCQATFVGTLCDVDRRLRRQLATAVESGEEAILANLKAGCRELFEKLGKAPSPDPCSDPGVWRSSAGVYLTDYAGGMTLHASPPLVSELSRGGEVRWWWRGSGALPRRAIVFALADGTRIELAMPRTAPPVIRTPPPGDRPPVPVPPPRTSVPATPPETLPTPGPVVETTDGPGFWMEVLSGLPLPLLGGAALALVAGLALLLVQRRSRRRVVAARRGLVKPSRDLLLQEPPEAVDVSPPEVGEPVEAPREPEAPPMEAAAPEQPSPEPPSPEAPPPELIDVEIEEEPLEALPGVEEPAVEPAEIEAPESGDREADQERWQALKEEIEGRLESVARPSEETERLAAVVEGLEQRTSETQAALERILAVLESQAKAVEAEPEPEAAEPEPEAEAEGTWSRLLGEWRTLEAAEREGVRRAVTALARLGEWAGCLLSVPPPAVEDLAPPARQERREAYETLRGFARLDAAVFERLREGLADPEADLGKPGGEEGRYLEESGLLDPGSGPLGERLRRHLLAPRGPGRVQGVVRALQYLIEAFPLEQLVPSERQAYRSAIRERLQEADLTTRFHRLAGEVAAGLGLRYREVRLYRARLGQAGYEFLEQASGRIDLSARVGEAVGTEEGVVVRVPELFLFESASGVRWSGRALVDEAS